MHNFELTKNECKVVFSDLLTAIFVWNNKNYSNTNCNKTKVIPVILF